VPIGPAIHRQRYGKRHRALRERVAREVEAGTATCARCKGPILPGEPFDLGHVDGGSPVAYAGPEHRRCNRSTSSRRNGQDAYTGHGAPYRSPSGMPWSRPW
jgi:hypothetical protein